MREKCQASFRWRCEQECTTLQIKGDAGCLDANPHFQRLPGFSTSKLPNFAEPRSEDRFSTEPFCLEASEPATPDPKTKNCSSTLRLISLLSNTKPSTEHLFSGDNCRT